MLNETNAKLGHIKSLKIVTLEGNPLANVREDMRRTGTDRLKAYWRSIALEGASFKDQTQTKFNKPAPEARFSPQRSQANTTS